MNTSLLFGKLTLDALPFYSPIAAGGAAVIVLGGLAVLILVTRLKAWGYLWREWLTTTDHKKIGMMYVILAMVMLLRGFVDALMLRAQQAIAMSDPGYLTPDHFQQIFSSHGTIMVFFMGMPFLFGLMNFVVPLQLGARDVAFPLLNAISLWLTAAGAALVMASLVIGVFSTGGWTGYPPYTELSYSPTVGVDYWIMALMISGVGTTLSGINFVVTIYKMRAPGMKLMQMPLFCWTALCANLLAVFALPGLTVAAGLLALDRYLGMHFFTNDGGGNVMNYANIFWIFGHPEVYILVLPAFGIFSSVIPTFSGKRLFGYNVLVYATMCIAVLSFTVWLHHFFTMGADANVNAFFGIMTMVIAVPTGVKVYDWILTMFRGRLRFETPMLWSIAFIVTFVIGGMTGVILAIPPLDYVFHNTLFLIAHFHNMLSPACCWPVRRLRLLVSQGDRVRARRDMGAAGVRVLGGGLLPRLHATLCAGFIGMSRRMDYYDQPAWQIYLVIAAIGALCVLCGIISQVIQLVVSIRNRAQTVNTAGDPWDSQTLEWSTSSPPPEYNFAIQPAVHSLDAFRVAKDAGQPHIWPDRYEPIEVPRNSVTGIVLGGSRSFWALRWSGTSGGWRRLASWPLSAPSSRAALPPIPPASSPPTRSPQLRGAGKPPSWHARRPCHDRERQPAPGHQSVPCASRGRSACRNHRIRLLDLSDERRDHFRAAVCHLCGHGTRTAGGPSGPELFDTTNAFVETMVLLASSFTFGMAAVSLKEGRVTAIRGWLVLTLVLGLGFIGLELREFSGLVERGATAQTSGFLSSFFVLLSTHGLHVLAGCIWIGVMLVQIAVFGLSRQVRSRLLRLSLFWHFLDLVWIVIFTIVYLPAVAVMSGPWEGENGGHRVAQPAAEARQRATLLFLGLGLALLLTGAAFGLAVFRLLPVSTLLPVIGMLALVQIAVQFRFFLHIDLSRSKREDLQLILFSGLLILIMVGGSIWIMTNLDQRMMG